MSERTIVITGFGSGKGEEVGRVVLRDGRIDLQGLPPVLEGEMRAGLPYKRKFVKPDTDPLDFFNAVLLEYNRKMIQAEELK